MVKQTTGPGRSSQRTIPIMFGQRECASVEIDRTALEEELATLFEGMKTIARAYGTPDENNGRSSRFAGQGTAYVIRRIEKFCESLVAASLLEWLDAQRSDEELLDDLGRGGSLDSPAFHVLIQRHALSGTVNDRHALTNALKKIAGVRTSPGPRRRYPSADLEIGCARTSVAFGSQSGRRDDGMMKILVP